jgi:hypothetical protein
MDEREVKNEYKTLQKKGELTPYVNNIERLKSTITPKQNIELKAILVGASTHEGALRARSLQLLDKKINQIDTRLTKESKENEERIRSYNTRAKIYHARSMSYRKLKSNKFRKTHKIHKPVLSPIKEASKENESRSASPWKTVTPKRKKWFFGLF